MEKYPKSGEHARVKRSHRDSDRDHVDSRFGTDAVTGFNYEETVKNLNKYYSLGECRSVVLSMHSTTLLHWRSRDRKFLTASCLSLYL